MDPMNAMKGLACDLVEAYARVLQRGGDAADNAFFRSGLGEMLFTTLLAAMHSKQQHSIESRPLSAHPCTHNSHHCIVLS